MKKAFIIVTVSGLESITRKLVNEIKAWHVKDLTVYVIRNDKNREGYAIGVNKGISEALKDGAKLFIVANPDISLKGIHPRAFFEAPKHFDVWGYAFEQDRKIYYGGEIDAVRLSGGLSSVKPAERFATVDFVSGSLLGFGIDVIESIGMWDEGYGMYYEDVDFCLRAKKAGFDVGIDTNVVYLHHEESKTNEKKSEQLAKNRFRFFLKYADVKQTAFETMRLPLTIMEYRSLIWKNIKDRPFLVNFFSLNISSVLIKLLNFVLFLFLIRFLSVTDYGLYTLLWAFIGILNPLADFGTTTFGITQLRNSDISYADLFSFRLVMSILIGVVAFLSALAFHITAGVGLALILSVILANNFSGSVLILLTNKNKAYVPSVVSSVFNTLMILVTIIVTVVYKSLAATLVAIASAYSFYAIVSLYIAAENESALSFRINTGVWKKIMKQSTVFLLLTLFAGIYFRIDIFVLEKLKGNSAVGIYSAGYKFFEALLFLASSYTIAATPILQRLLEVNKEECFKRLKRDSRLLFSFGFASAVVLALIAPAILPFLLHNSYAGAIPLFQITIFALPFMLVSTVYMSILFILKKTKLILGLFISQAILNLVLNLIYVPQYSYFASAWLTVTAELINVAAVIYLVRKEYAHIT